MNHSWGVYAIRGRLEGGKETEASDKHAVSYFVRWRVDSRMRRRSFKTRGHANTFRDLLIAAKSMGWAADDKGWPINPASVAPLGSVNDAPESAEVNVLPSFTVESYVEDVWWPTLRLTLSDKNRLGHRRNADLAVQLLRLRDGDRRIGHDGAHAGDSMPMPLLTSDDVKAALVARRHINGRTAAVNRRRIEKAAAEGERTGQVIDVTLEPEIASPATVRSLYITMKMIFDAAPTSAAGDPMEGAAAFAPKPRPRKMSTRLVLSIDELFDFADAIAQLGPVMPDGRPCGAQFRSLILVKGTTGPRPGELVAHQPDWMDLDQTPAEIRFHKTEAAVYGAELEEHERGQRERPLKLRDEDDFRAVPLISDVQAALLEHLERGYASSHRTWTSPTGRGHLDWGNIRKNYWRPALHAVFAGTSKAVLVDASPKILRKTDITWWADRGIHQTLAAEWAGHSEEVARIYYASRASSTFAREVALLEPRGN